MTTCFSSKSLLHSVDDVVGAVFSHKDHICLLQL